MQIVAKSQVGDGIDIIFVIEDFDQRIQYYGNPLKVYLSAEAAWDFDDVSQPYYEKFLSQFDLIYSPHPYHLANQESSPPFLPWMIGGGHDDYKHKADMTYEKLMDQGVGKKDENRPISCIVSNQMWKVGHRQRLRYIKELKRYFGDIISVYGKAAGKPVKCKWEAISPHKYHICIENQSKKDLFTEKILDPWLACSMPLYDGAYNINEFFPDKSLIRIDANDLSGSIKSIKKCLDHDSFNSNMSALLEARSIVLERFSIYRRICELAIQIQAKRKSLGCIKSMPLLEPRSHFAPRQRRLDQYIYKIKMGLKQASGIVD